MFYFFDFLFEESSSPQSTITKEAYYHQFLEPLQLQSYQGLHNTDETFCHINIQKEIHPFHLLFGCDTNVILKKMGAPKHKTSATINGIRFDVLFFKKEFFQYWSIIQIHLLNNRFALAKITVPHHSKNIKTTFCKLLSIKYSEAINPNTIENIIVCDESNNRLMYKNFFYPSLLFTASFVQEFKYNEKQQSSSSAKLQEHSKSWYLKL